jgi:signal transduction histidine kinase
MESIVFDYRDTGRDVSANGSIYGVRTVKPGALRRVMSNLIDNALKFAGRAAISVSHTSEGETTIAVMDRGPGIEPDQLEAVVKPFVRLLHRSGEQAPGVGLGLAIARQLAHDMNASLVLQNREDGGLSAQIVFPNCSAPAPGSPYSSVL